MSTTDAAVVVTHVAVARIRARWSGVNGVPATAVAHAVAASAYSRVRAARSWGVGVAELMLE
jgi:hypothetical protein